MATCEIRNGTYGCDQDKDHDGKHKGRFWNQGRYRVAEFTDGYSEVEVSG